MNANLSMAEAALAVITVLRDLAVTPWGISVENHGSAVVVHIDDCNVTAVDLLGIHLHLGHDTTPTSGNYTRAGDVTVYGYPLRVTVFCGRPESMRAVSVDLSKAAS